MIYKYQTKDANENAIMIIFDTEKLSIVRDKIVDNCGIIKHCSEKFDERNVHADIAQKQKLNHSVIKNVMRAEELVSYKSLGDYYVYEYTYDEYILLVPELIDALDNIINGKPAIIDYVLNIKNFKMGEYSEYNDIENVKKLLDEYVTTHDKNKLETAKQLINQYHHFIIEIPKECINNYYDELRSCYTIEFVSKVEDDSLETNESIDEGAKKK